MKNKNIKYYMDLNYEIKLRKLPDEEGGYVASISELGESAFSQGMEIPFRKLLTI